MRAAFIISMLLGGALLLGGCQETPKTPAPEVGIVDMSRLVRDSEPGKAAQTFLEGMQKDLTSKLAGMQKAVQANPSDEKASQKFQEQYVLLQQKLQTEEQNVTNVLLDHVFRVINAYREKNGLRAIVRSEAAISYEKSMDLTDAILKEVNKTKIDYKPVTQDLPKEEAAKDSSKPTAKPESSSSEPAQQQPKTAASKK